MLEGIFKKERETEWEEAQMCTTLCMLSMNIWSGFALRHAGVFVCFAQCVDMWQDSLGVFVLHVYSNRDQCGGTNGAYQSQENLLYYRSALINHPASPSSAHGSGPSTASFFSLWSRETPYLTNTKTPAVLLHFSPSQRSKSLYLHLLSPYLCHHIHSITKSSAAFDFFPFSSSVCYLSVLCASSLYQCQTPPKVFHVTTILPPFTLYRMQDFVV